MTEHSKKYSRYLLSDELWQEIHPIVLELCPKNKVGRKRMDDRKALNAIFYVLRSGIPWDALHPDLGASSTVHDRFMYFVEQGLFLRLWQLSLIKYDELKKIDWQFLAMDGCHTVAPIACEETGPSYKHRGKSGVNRSLLTDGNGIPLALVIAPANCLDMHLAEPTLQSFAIQRPNPDQVEQHICLDKGYDCAQVDQLLEDQKFIPHVRRRGIDYSNIPKCFCFSTLPNNTKRRNS